LVTSNFNSLNKNYKIFFWIIIVIFSTAFSFFVGGDRRNFLLIGFLFICPLLLLSKFSTIRVKEIWIYIPFTVIFIVSILHPQSFRISTLMYSFLFMFGFVLFLRIIYSGKVPLENYMGIIKILIIAYGCTLILQQIAVLANLPFIINEINIDLNTMKLNSLATEPSHSARILVLLMYSYILMREHTLKRKYHLVRDISIDKYIWILFLYSMLTMGSSAAILFLPLIFIKFIKIQNLAFLACFVALVIFVLHSTDFVAFDRVFNFVGSLSTLNPEDITAADHSGSLRLVPIILAFSMLDPSTIEFWFGHGIDYDSEVLSRLLTGIPDGVGVGNVITNFLLNYGMVATFLFGLMLVKLCFRNLYDAIVWLVLMSSVAFNTQLFWISLILLSANKFYWNNSKVIYPPLYYVKSNIRKYFPPPAVMMKYRMQNSK